MTPYPTARLAYLTQQDDLLILNFQFEEGQPRIIDVSASGARFERIGITPAQLANIIKDGVGVLG